MGVWKRNKIHTTNTTNSISKKTIKENNTSNTELIHDARGFIRALVNSLGYVLVAIITLLILMAFLFAVLRSFPKSNFQREIHSFDKLHTVKLYTVGSEKKRGTSIYLDLHDSEGKKIRSNIYQQWYCVNAEIQWIDDETIIINNVEMNVFTDKVYFEKKEGLFCPSQ